MYLDFSGYSLYGHGNIHDTKARYSKPRIKEPQDFSCPKTLKVVSVTFHTPLDLTIHDSQGMYDPGAEHDACGVGMVTTLNKRPERKIVDDAIEVLVNLNHRGAVGAEENTGDGAGILMSMPDEFMRATAGVELPEEGHYAAGIAFLDRDIATSGQQEQAIAKIVREEGLEVLAWRVVPTNPDGLGLQALASMPAFKTLVVADPEGQLAGIELDRKTFRIRKRVEHEVGIYFASLSARTITYKGMLTTMQLKPPELRTAWRIQAVAANRDPGLLRLRHVRRMPRTAAPVRTFHAACHLHDVAAGMGEERPARSRR